MKNAVEEFENAVEELKVKIDGRKKPILAKIKELETKEEELNKKIASLWQNVVEAELADDIDAAKKLKKDIEKAKLELAELQEHKNAYKKAADSKEDYSEELGELKKKAIKARDYRLQELEKTKQIIQERVKQYEEMEKDIHQLKRIADQLSINDTEGYALSRNDLIIGLINSKLIDLRVHGDVASACQYWLTDSEERFKERIGDVEES